MELIATLVLLLQADRADLESVRKAIRYLARHQAEDGSWGRRPPACTCPREPAPPPMPVDAPTRARIGALIAELGDDDPQKRLAAQRAFAEIGPVAVPALLDAEKSGDFETRGRASAALDAVELQLTAPDLELTGLVLYLMSSAGYHSDWPRPEEGIHPGRVMKKGLAWLTARQDTEGRIDGADPTAQAIAALALNDDLMVGRREELKVAAEKSAAYVLAHPGDDPRALLWQTWALGSANFNQFAIPREGRERAYPILLRRWAERPFSATATLQAHLARPIERGAAAAPPVEWILNLPPSLLDRESTYFASTAAWGADGPKGETWTKWNTQVKAWLPPLQIKRGCEAGAWSGKGTADRMRAAIYGGLAQQFFYH